MEAVDAAWVTEGRWLTGTSRRDVSASPADVWAVLSDPGSWSDWHESFSEFDAVADRFIVGTPADAKEWRFRHQLVINDYRPERSIGFTMTGSTVGFMMANYAETISIEPGPTGDTCTIEHTGRVAPSLLGWLTSAYWLGFTLVSMHYDFKASTERLAALAEEAAR